ncbi:hypothetical protein Dde_1811 [Oleidesulfovibrio alaskensis G20]|uniref:Uncharacterized protein n=1 Tax=Oleidesulfovibrio alaskensis (strain ATCC BAA-1058 / DSM 17464 / G20) TaxID=207559 RepID=Q310N8_OLEA2|nr:PxxKW family cysteine-rich protein [Oleidesulfovibrio alaskensis]ABB38608.1 hypothetical protein Dde_1811 [Oleidesulfovibrio alaskensis G20]MBG0773909.1 hypothetical protein [Oleidesulfovibrio alaskensis]MBL3581621.1 PxxKW family cysteine-rich protein [Oleidesulfovibrio alaskensis]MBL3588100.1 PxxKW family cysteine-rich protein [bacterium]
MSDERMLEGAVKTAEGVELNGMVMAPVVEQCDGCDRVRSFEGEKFCSSYPFPAKKWAQGNCNFATHVARVTASGKKVNPLKASKRAARG